MRAAFGEYELDTEARTLRCHERRVPVQAKAFDLLAYLIEHRDHVVSANELLDALWPELHVTPAALSTAVQKARQAVGDDGEHQRVVRTEHGRGFRFVADVRMEPAEEMAPPTLADTRRRRLAMVWAAAAGVAALLLVAAAAWLLTRPAAAPAPTSSVAVLPFANLSGDAAADAFTAGIHDDVLTQISKIRDLKVIARTSVERLDPGLSIREIGSRLGVAAVLEGGVQRAEDQIRINVQLSECETQTHLWAETYDRELTAANIFGIQSEIARSVAGALRATLSTEEQERIAAIPTENLTAYQAYLLGKQRLAKRNSEALAESVEYFQQAIESDPAFALAYVGLADTYNLQVEYSGLPPDETLAKAQAAADRALALDDRLAEVYTSLGGIKYAQNDYEAAEAAFQRAMDLNPNYVTAYHWYGHLLGINLGRHDEALEMFKKAAELDPRSPAVLLSVGIGLARVGRFDESLAWFHRAIEIDPEIALGYEWIGFHYWLAEGQLDDAVRWLAKSVSVDPGNPEFSAFLGMFFLDLGDVDRAEYWSERSIELAPESFFSNRAMQLLGLYRGDLSAALEYGRRASETELFWVFRFSSSELARDREMRAGRYLEARAALRAVAPELLNEDFPEVERRNYRAAIDLALISSKTGEGERARRLLERSLECIQRIPRLGEQGHIIADVQIYALQGDKQKALSALRRAIDQGWRDFWWYRLNYDPTLESLHGEPEFQAMVEEIEADMAAQLERVREMERRGELTLPVEPDAQEDPALGSLPADLR